MLMEIPYEQGTISYSLCADDWSDLTARQIAEVLGVKPRSINNAIYRILMKTGYRVPYKKDPRGSKPKKARVHQCK